MQDSPEFSRGGKARPEDGGVAVRDQASNTEPEQEVAWARSPASDTVYHLGKVAVGTDQGREALTVAGNVQVAGNVLSPSDVRLKQGIAALDTRAQLENVQRLEVVEFRYKPEYLATFSAEERAQLAARQVGVIAQEVAAVVPDAVESSGDVTLASGRQVNNMLIVNKDRLFLGRNIIYCNNRNVSPWLVVAENIGAVRELSKVTDNLGHRIDELETHTVRMSRYCTVVL